jgi:hypothetical protein
MAGLRFSRIGRVALVGDPDAGELAEGATFRLGRAFVDYDDNETNGADRAAPGSDDTVITAAQCRSARTLLGWSVAKLAAAASVSESALDDFELERRRPDTATIDAIQRAFETVGVAFLPSDDVRLRNGAAEIGPLAGRLP